MTEVFVLDSYELTSTTIAFLLFLAEAEKLNLIRHTFVKFTILASSFFFNRLISEDCIPPYLSHHFYKK